MMKWFFFALLFVASAMGAERRDPFANPIDGFSEAFTPILRGFETAKIETTLRGFVARADSFPGFRASETTPSEYGLYLNVAVRDAGDVKGFSDHSEQKGAIMRRLVQIPPPKGGEQAIVIELDHGEKVPAEIIRAINACIRGVVEFSGHSGK